MKLFRRINRVISVNLNELLDKMEEPGKMLRHLIRSLEEGLEEARRHLAEAEASRESLRRALEQQERLSRQWLERAEAVLASGEEQLARNALREKRRHDISADRIRQEYSKSGELSRKLGEGLASLEMKVAEARGRLELLIARERLAKAESAVNETMGSLSESAWAFQQFEEMEEKVARRESLAKAARELLPEGKPPETAFRELEDEAAVERELENLRKKMGGQG